MSKNNVNKTDIEWATHVWNPFVGCFGGCSYCYARRLVKRFLVDKYLAAEEKELEPVRDTKEEVFFTPMIEKSNRAIKALRTAALREKLKDFKTVALRHQLNKTFPDDAVVFANPLSDPNYWTGENKQHTRLVFKTMAINPHIEFIMLTKFWSIYRNTILPMVSTDRLLPVTPLNCTYGFTWDNAYHLSPRSGNIKNDFERLRAETKELREEVPGVKILWNMEPLSLENLLEFMVPFNKGYYAVKPDWIIYGPRTPNRKIITDSEMDSLWNVKCSFAAYGVPFFIKGINFPDTETLAFSNMINLLENDAPEYIATRLRKWGKL